MSVINLLLYSNGRLWFHSSMTLVVVPRHLPHKKQLMRNLSLPSRLTNSHIAPRIKITVARHHQKFLHVRRMLRLIVLTPLLSGLMMSLSLAHINITSQTFRLSRLTVGFMSVLSPNFITCVIRTGKTLLNGPTSHGRNTRPTFFKSKVLCSCPRTSIMQYRMRSQCGGRWWPPWFIFMYYEVFAFDVFMIVCCGLSSCIIDYCMYYLWLFCIVNN
jgi:hypothetical protein